ncbi:MAG: 2-isopropylmalate synthase, partial [Nitriliruptoraceae bacterium]
EVDVAFAAFKQVADKKGELTLEDVRAIVMDHSGAAADVEGHELASFSCANTPDTLPTATVTIRPAGGGEYVTATATGDGMVDAACTATREAIGRDDVKLTVFNVGAVTEGIDALATVTITIEVVGGTFTGRGVATDVVEASARAFLDAINRSDRLTKRDGEFKV